LKIDVIINLHFRPEIVEFIQIQLGPEVSKNTENGVGLLSTPAYNRNQK